MRSRVVLHIGLHKTGTTFLQGTWAANRAVLADHGVRYPGAAGEPVQRLAALDALGRQPRGTVDHRISGQWQRIVSLAATAPDPTVLLSAEVLSTATPRQARSIAAAFGDREVHVMVTARDVARVLVSAWQETVKNDATWTWQEYVDAVTDPARRGANPARGFWLTQDLPGILAAWSGPVPAERVHVVTVPPPGAAPGELLARACRVVGVDAAELTASAARDNTALDAAGTEVVRRLNVLLGHRLNQRQHSHVVKNLVVRELAAQRTGRPYALPPELTGWAGRESSRQVTGVRDGGYAVVGDLDDLRPRQDPAAPRPDGASVEATLDAALVGLSVVTQRYARAWWRRHRDDGATSDPTAASSTRRLAFRVRRAGARAADRNRFAAKAGAAYVALTRRSRRSD